MKLILLLIFLLLTFWPNVASATDYYVRPSGGNYGLEDGSSYANAWDGFSNIDWAKVDDGNGKLFIAGTNREQLAVRASGEENSPIRIMSCMKIYGASVDDAGEIIGADAFIGAESDWKEQSDGLWVRNLGGIEPTLVIFNDSIFGINDQSPDLKHEWKYLNPNLYVYTESGDHNPASYYSAIEAGQRNYGIIVEGKNYINLFGLKTTKANKYGILVTGETWSKTTHVYIFDCQSYYNCSHGFKAAQGVESGTVTVSHISYDKCIAHHNGSLAGPGVACGFQSSDGSGDITYANSIAYNNGANGFRFGETINGTMYGCNSYNNLMNGLAISCSESAYNNIVVRNNYIHDNGNNGIYMDEQIENTTASVSIYKNLIVDNNYNGIEIYAGNGGIYDTLLICYNIISRNRRNGVLFWHGNMGNAKLMNNTVYNNGNNNDLYRAVTVAPGVNNITMMNNILYMDSNDPGIVTSVLSISNTAGEKFIINHNIYYSTAEYLIGWRGTKYTSAEFASYQSVSGQDANSYVTDPLFVSSGSDFHLQGTSPARDKGAYVGIDSDYAGTPIPQGLDVDIGAFEFVSNTTLDTLPPIGAVIINNGDVVTYSVSVLLSLSATDQGKELDGNALMLFSNDGKEWSTPEPYATGKIWTLAPAAGEKTVYVKFCDAAGNWMNEPAEDKIVYEESQKINIPLIGTVSINGNDYFTDTRTVFLTLLAIDEGKELDENAAMCFSNDGEVWSAPEPYVTGKIWTLSPGSGEKIVYVKFCDAAGNWMMKPAQDRIYCEESKVTCDNPRNLRPVSATASSEWLPRYSKNNAFDGNPLTAWSAFSFVKRDQFITLDLGEIKKLRGLNMYASRLFGTDFFPTDFQMEISRDNSTWASIGKEWGYTPPIQSPYAEKWEFGGIDCRYVRIAITKSKTLFLFLHLAQIAEIELYGCDIEDDIPLITGQASAVRASQEKLDKIIIEDSIDINQGELTTPGKPEVRFE